jgi:thioredoxin 1
VVFAAAKRVKTEDAPPPFATNNISESPCVGGPECHPYLKDVEEFDALVKANPTKVVVVDFTASYCGPCKFITPIFEREAKSGKYPNMIFRKCDVDEVEELQERYEVTQMPTFIFFENGSTDKVGHRIAAPHGCCSSRCMSARPFCWCC